MGLNFLRSSKKSSLSPEAKALLESYMAGAKKEIGFVSKDKAETKAGAYAEDFYKTAKAEGLKKSDIKAMEKQMAKELKQYGLKERVNYAANLRAAEENPMPVFLKDAGIGMAAVAAMAAASASGQHGVSAGIFGAGMAVIAAKTVVCYAGASTNDAEKRKVEEFTELKHAQLALKQLRHKFTAAERAANREEAAKLFAAGYGQPSGCLIQPPIYAIRQKNQSR